jgi:hypothetical protein
MFPTTVGIRDQLRCQFTKVISKSLVEKVSNSEIVGLLGLTAQDLRKRKDLDRLATQITHIVPFHLANIRVRISRLWITYIRL